MRIRTIVTVTAVMLMVVARAGAQAPAAPTLPQYVDPVNGLSIDDAIRLALAREPAIQATRTDIEVARGLEQQAGLRANPSVSVERRDRPRGPGDQTMIMVQWPLELFRRSARVAVAARERAVVQLTVADRERLLAAEVRARFGELLVAVRDLGVLEELVDSVFRQHALVASRVDEGASPALDRDLVEIELRRWQADRLLQAGRVEAASYALKRVIGLSPDEPLAVRDDLERAVSLDAAAVRTGGDAVAVRPDVQAAAARIEVADARADRARRDGRIDLSVVGGYGRMEMGTNNAIAGAMLMVPLFNRNQGEIAAARAERAGATAGLAAAKLDASAEIAAALAADGRAREAVRLFTGGSRALAARNLDVVRQTYELGRATVFDVLAEQRRYLDFERAYTETLRAAFEARTALLEATGGVR